MSDAIELHWTCHGIAEPTRCDETEPRECGARFYTEHLRADWLAGQCTARCHECGTILLQIGGAARLDESSTIT